MKQSHIALIVSAGDEKIVAVPWLKEPVHPLHSGFTNEETRIMSHYYDQWKKYHELEKTGILCDLASSLKILKEQYPDRKVLPHIKSHYNITNVTLHELLGQPKRIFAEGEMMTCVYAELLPEKEFGPDLVVGKEYPLNKITTDAAGNHHFDVGLLSHRSYISSYETGEHLPDGDKIHWCHSSRFM